MCRLELFRGNQSPNNNLQNNFVILIRPKKRSSLKIGVWLKVQLLWTLTVSTSINHRCFLLSAFLRNFFLCQDRLLVLLRRTSFWPSSLVYISVQMLYIFFKGRWHLVAFIFTCSYLFLFFYFYFFLFLFFIFYFFFVG